MNNRTTKFKRLLALLLVVQVLMTSVSTAALSQDEVSGFSYSNSDVEVAVTLVKNETSRMLSIEANLINESITFSGYQTPEDTIMETISNYEIKANGTYLFALLYQKDSVDRELSIPIEIDDLVSDATESTESEVPRSNDLQIRHTLQSQGEILSFTLNSANPSLKSPSDYKFGDPSQATFLVDLNIFPANIKSNREVVVKIPRHFALEKNNLEKLAGTTFKSVDIDYAGYFDVTTNTFTWDEGDNTIITFKLHDVQNDDDNTPMGITFAIYQNTQEIASNGKAPKVDYTFSVSSNMSDYSDGFTFTVPFSESGFNLKGINNTDDYIASLNDFNEQVFTIKNYRPLFSSDANRYNNSHPYRLDPLVTKFNLEKDPSALPLKSMAIEIPLPSGYIWVKDANNKLFSKNGADDDDLNLGINDPDWIKYDELKNSLVITLNATIAKGLLQSSSTIGKNAAQVQISLLRVNDDQSVYDRNGGALSQKIPYDLFAGEVKKAQGPSQYTFEDTKGSKVTSLGSTLVIEYTSNPANFQFQKPQVINITKTSIDQTLPKMSFNSNNFAINKAYKDVEIKYDFSEMNHTKSKVWISAINHETPYIDRDATMILEYKDPSGTMKKHDISYASTNDDNARTKKFTIEGLKTQFGIDVAEVHSISYKYDYVIAKGSRSDYAIPAVQISTERRPGSNNEGETFNIKATFTTNGSEVLDYATLYKVNLNPNNYTITAHVSDRRTTNVTVGKTFKNAYAIGNLTIPAFHEPTSGAYLDLSSSDGTLDALQFAQEIRITGGSGVVRYQVKHDATVYEENFNNTESSVMLNKVDIASGKTLDTLKIYPDGLDDNSNGKLISWSLHFKNGMTPLEYYKDGIFQAIPDNTNMMIVSRFMAADAYVWAQGQGSTVNFKVPNVALEFTTATMNLSAQEKITLTKTNETTYLNIGMENKGKQLGYSYESAEQSFAYVSGERNNDVLDMLSLAGSLRLNTNFKPNEQVNRRVTIDYQTFNVDTSQLKTSTIVLRNSEIKNNTIIKLDLKNNEVLSSFEYRTDIFDNYLEDAFLSFDFITKDPTPLTSVYGREIRLNESYLLDVEMSGKIVGAHGISDLGRHNAVTPHFILPESPKEAIEGDLSNTFFAQVLKQEFSPATDPSYAFISKDHGFDKPVISYILNTPRDLSDLTDARFSVKNSLSEDVLSRIGYLRLGANTGVKPIKGRVEYTVRDVTTGLITKLSSEIKGNELNQRIDLPLSENQVIQDIVIYADNLGGFTSRQRYSFQYFLRNNQGVETFVSDTGEKPITNGYFSDVVAELSYFNGLKRESINSTTGSTVNFYSTLNRFKIIPDTAIPTLAYYQDLEVDLGRTLGFSFVNYRETQTYTNATFSFIANGVNEQIFPLTEGLEISNALNDGQIIVRYNDASQKQFTFNQGDTKRFNLDVSDSKYIIDIEVYFPLLKAGRAPISGSLMGINFLLLEPLKDETRDGNVINPAQSFDIQVRFDADNYDPNTGMESFPINGESIILGESHRTKQVDSALFANFILPNIPSNYVMNLLTDLVSVNDLDVPPSRTIYQGSAVEFEHTPRIAWETARLNMSPEKAFVDNPKFYYVIDSRFEYNNDSFKFYDNAGDLLETVIAYIPSNLKNYSVIEVSFIGAGYHLDLAGITNGARSDFFDLGTATFSLKTTRFETGENIKAVLNSYVDLGNNIAADPDNYVYSHNINKYILPSYDFGEYSGKSQQHLPLGSGLDFKIYRNQVIGINNNATTPNQKGAKVFGTEITEFGEELIVSTGIGPIYNTYIYVPIPKENLSYTVTERNGDSRTLNSDFSMNLSGPLMLKTQSSGSAINYVTSYAGDIQVDTEYPSQMGLSGNPITETGYESYDDAKKSQYTMMRIYIPELKVGEYLVFDMPMRYHGTKTSEGEEIARTNLQYTYSEREGLFGTAINAALDLSYHINDLSISGTVWEDLDNNSIHNPNGLDRGIANIKVKASKILNGQEYTFEAMSDPEGKYTLNLPGGHYKVTFEDRFNGYEYPNKLDFVKPNQGSASDYSSKANPNKGDDYGSVAISVNERDVRYVNAGYYRVLPEREADALIKDTIIWVGETRPLQYNNPLNLTINLKNQTLQVDGKNIATIRTNPARVTGEHIGVVDVPYSYPDGQGSVIEKTFKVTVLDTFTVSYDVAEQNGAKQGTLIPVDGYVPPHGLSNLQERIFDQQDTNLVSHTPNPKANTSKLVFDGWYLGDGTRVDLTSYRIVEDITFYARFADDSNEDGIADKYQVRFEYITEDGYGNGNTQTDNFVEWVTRYHDPSLSGEALNALSNLSETAPVSPITIQANPSTRTDYQFTQWQDDTISNTTYPDGLAITKASFIESEVTFTAQYNRMKLTVSYAVKDEQGTLSPANHKESVFFGDTVNDMPQPHGLRTQDVITVFDGWYLVDGTAFDPETYLVESNITVYAHFARDDNDDGIADKYQVRFEYITEDGLGNGNIGNQVFVEWVVRYHDSSLSGEALNALSNLSQTAPVSPKTPQANPRTLANYEFVLWDSNTQDKRNYRTGGAIVNDLFTESNVQFTARYSKKNAPETKEPEETKPNDNKGKPGIVIEKGKLPDTGMVDDVIILYGVLFLALGALLIILKKHKKTE